MEGKSTATPLSLVVLVLKWTFFDRSTLTASHFGTTGSYVPHFKGLISGNLDFEAQGHDSTFTFLYAPEKKAILRLFYSLKIYDNCSFSFSSKITFSVSQLDVTNF